MKTLALALGAWLAVAGPAAAQVTVEVSLDQDQFLPGETLNAAVRITNRSGQTLQFGADNAWLTFAVESPDGFVVSRTGDVPVKGEFSLESAKVAIKRVDLAPYFNFAHPGRYAISATVTIKEWNRQITSEPKPFDIIQGARLWEQEVGVPKAPGATNPVPELRKYMLQQANYLRKQLVLYLQITDRTGKVYRVFPIGPMLSFGQPEAQVDKRSNLHVLYQDGPHSFNYTVVDPDGKVIIRHTYAFTSQSRPRMKVDENGNLQVTGATRRITSRDVPPSNSAEDNAPASRP